VFNLSARLNFVVEVWFQLVFDLKKQIPHLAIELSVGTVCREQENDCDQDAETAANRPEKRPTRTDQGSPPAETKIGHDEPEFGPTRRLDVGEQARSIDCQTRL
jgi:hypothetical protein